MNMNFDDVLRDPPSSHTWRTQQNSQITYMIHVVYFWLTYCTFLRKIVFLHAPVFLHVGQQGDRPAATKTENCDHHILLVFPFWRLCVNIAKFDIFLPLEPFFYFTILATPPTVSVVNKGTI